MGKISRNLRYNDLIGNYMEHLCEGDFIIIPKGTSHRPVCKELVKCLLIETTGTLTKENTGGTYCE